MPKVSDVSFSRSRLCDLAGVERGKHDRWISAGHLDRKTAYSRLDFIRAAALQHVWDELGPSLAASVWRQIRGQLDVPGVSLDVVIDPATQMAAVARGPEQLSAALPRDTRVIVLDVATPVNAALGRLEKFLMNHERRDAGKADSDRPQEQMVQ